MATIQDYRDALDALIPYALSRAEELENFKEHGDEDLEHDDGADAAWEAIEAARALMAVPHDAPDAAPDDRDDSAVIHADAVDDASEWPLPWRFETDDGASYFATEDEACAMQRDHRKRSGFDPMTGERSPQTPDASALMLDALRLAAERIEMNNYGGEEDEHLAVIRAAIATGEA